ncbi:hypothetical protein HDU92_008132, partial [Lobulomyces angularis]
MNFKLILLYFLTNLTHIINAQCIATSNCGGPKTICQQFQEREPGDPPIGACTKFELPYFKCFSTLPASSCTETSPNDPTCQWKVPTSFEKCLSNTNTTLNDLKGFNIVLLNNDDDTQTTSSSATKTTSLQNTLITTTTNSEISTASSNSQLSPSSTLATTTLSPSVTAAGSKSH